jgi:hypothetical protein
MLSKTVSYSRLSAYQECPELYRLRYIVKPSGYTAPLQEPLIKGSLAHSCIEEYLQGAPKDVAIEIAITNWLVDCCKLQIQHGSLKKETKEEMQEASSIYDCLEDKIEEEEATSVEAYNPGEGEGVSVDLVIEYALSCGHLLHRASATYNAEDKIRNKDGTVPKSPLDYPPTKFRQEYENAGLASLRLEIDNQATRNNLSFKRMSLANIAAWGACYVFNFELPQEISHVDAIELPLENEKVYFGPKKDLYWNGFIDTIYRASDGAVVINDHKTESARRRSEDVAFDLQLNSYAAVRYEQTNRLPEYISITHLASNSFIVAHTDPEIMQMSMEYLEQIQAEIENDIERKGQENSWMKKWPSKYGSPCLRRYNDVLTSACPYIRRCWPEYAACINDELVEYLGY